MRIVVSDSSCLIDMQKASLLDAFLRLPFEILIPNTLFADELQSFTAAEKTSLMGAGLRVVDLPGSAVLRAQAVVREAPRLTSHDAFALVLAEDHPGCILLTGDGLLRRVAGAKQIEVHGVLWVVDRLHEHAVVSARRLVAALQTLADDNTVRLPRREMLAAVRRLEDEAAGPGLRR
jgi:predicted nucleic acid-binding protein